MDETSLHVLLDGARIKTLPSRLGVTELARLAAAGARPAGPSPLLAGTGTAVEIERTVNATGLAGLAGAQLNVGYHLAGQRVILRMDGTQMPLRPQGCFASRCARQPCGLPLTPKTTAAPGTRKSGQAQACPRDARGAQPRRGGASGRQEKS